MDMRIIAGYTSLPAPFVDNAFETVLIAIFYISERKMTALLPSSAVNWLNNHQIKCCFLCVFVTS